MVKHWTLAMTIEIILVLIHLETINHHFKILSVFFILKESIFLMTHL